MVYETSLCIDEPSTNLRCMRVDVYQQPSHFCSFSFFFFCDAPVGPSFSSNIDDLFS